MQELTSQQRSLLKTALEQLEKELIDLLSITEAGAKPVKLKDNQGRLSRMDELRGNIGHSRIYRSSPDFPHFL